MHRLADRLRRWGGNCIGRSAGYRPAGKPGRGSGFELLEPRHLLSTGPVITEFMAANVAALADGDGNYEDWIEIYNPTSQAVNLDGWHLTDDADALDRWPFPDVTIDAGRYLVVFASGRDEDDYVDPRGYLHTNFGLAAGGESLALVRPDGLTVADAYWDYPEQLADVSYGRTGEPLVSSGAVAEIQIPQDGSLEATWTAADFVPDATWTTGPTAVGYDLGGGQGTTAEPLRIDFSRSISTGPIQPGWLPFEHDGTAAATRSFPHDDLAGPGNSVDVTIAGNTHWRDYTPATGDFAPLSNLLSDGPLCNVPATMTLTLGNLRDGVYEITTYHHTTRFGPNDRPPATPFDVYLTDGEATHQTVVLGAVMSDNGSAELSTQTIPFTVRGGSAVEIEFVRGPSEGDGDHFALPGFELSFLREPGVADVVVTDVSPQMHGENSSAYLRVPFEVADPAAVYRLRLRMKYDDGFVAYLNGTEIARRNAPDIVGWNTAAEEEHPTEDALLFEDIDVTTFRDRLHTGTNVLAIQGLNLAADDEDFLVLPELIASGAEGTRYFPEPTPGSENAPGALGVVADTRFSVDRGFYDAPFELEISTETPGAEIRYTTDGSEPTAATGIVYTGPITIGGHTILRAAAFREGYIPTNVDTQTYVFLDDVVRQDGAGFPTGWGIRADYAMDNHPADLARIAGDSAYSLEEAREIVVESLRALPTISLVMDVDDVFGPGGIYANTEGRGYAWERPTSVELIHPDGTADFQIDAGIRIQGFTSRDPGRNPKHSLRLIFRDQYGAGKLEYPFFGESATDEFDTIVLRSNAQDAWVYNIDSNRNGTFARDQWLHETQAAMGQPAVSANYVHLYINGLYWGVYNPTERPDDSFGESYFGGDDEDYDVLKNHEEVLAGNNDAYFELLTLIQRDPNNFSAGYRDLSSDATYRQVLQYVDPHNLADYMIHNMYAAVTDWPGNNYILRNRVTGEGFLFFDWDGEHAFKTSITTNRTVAHGRDDDSPTKFHHALRSNAEYRMLFADHVYRAFSEGGVLYVDPDHPQWDSDHPEWNVPAARWMSIAERIEPALIAEAARWGDYARDFYGVGQLFTPHDQYVALQNSLLANWFPQRSAIVWNQFRSQGLYPAIDPPVFQIDGVPHRGGQIDAGASLTMAAAAGTIYYTTDGSDPRLPGGIVNAEHARQFDGVADLLSESTTVKARGYAGGQWSALNEAEFLVAGLPVVADLVVTELNYHPYDPTPAESAVDPAFSSADFEFIELYNTSNRTLNLMGTRLAGDVELDLDAALQVAPRAYVVIAANPAAFAARYGSEIPVAGPYRDRLSNGGGEIRLLDRSGAVLVELEYDDSADWPGRADGKGASLELIDLRGDYGDPDNWRSSSEYGGSPSAPGMGPTSDVVVNEVLSHSGGTLLDAIELHNTTDRPIEVGGWYLSGLRGWESNAGEGNYKKYRIEDGTTIDAHGYLVFDERHFNPSGGTDPDNHPNDFSLDGAHGGDVWLMEADAGGNLVRFADHVEFAAAAAGESFGRWPDGSGDLVPMSSRTLAPAGSNARPRVGPLIISEVMYHPPDPGGGVSPADLEFIEIYNPTAISVDLENWRMRKGIDFNFPVGVDLAPGETLVVVPFNPANTVKAAAFREQYRIDDSVELVGGYSGKLDNGGERVQLQRPDSPPIDEPDFVPKLLEDEVIYDVIAPWPTDPNGGGESLSRRAIVLWGNDAVSWIATAPSPGQADLYLHGGDANLDGLTDVRDFNIWNANKFTSGTDWISGDFNGDGRTDVRDFNIWNAHKFTSAPGPAPVDAVLEEASVSDPTGPDAGLVELAWVYELEQSSRLRRPSEDDDPADAALDKLLTRYRP